MPSSLQLDLWLDRVDAIVKYQQVVLHKRAAWPDQNWISTPSGRPSGFALRDSSSPITPDNIAINLDVVDERVLQWPKPQSSSSSLGGAVPTHQRKRRKTTEDEKAALEAVAQGEVTTEAVDRTAAQLGWDTVRVRQHINNLKSRKLRKTKLPA